MIIYDTNQFSRNQIQVLSLSYDYSRQHLGVFEVIPFQDEIEADTIQENGSSEYNLDSDQIDEGVTRKVPDRKNTKHYYDYLPVNNNKSNFEFQERKKSKPRLPTIWSKAIIASPEVSIFANKTNYKTEKKVPPIESKANMKSGLPYQPRTYQYKNLTKPAMFRNESINRIENTFSKVTTKPSFNAQNVIQRHKEKEVVKKKTNNSSEVFSINKNNTSYKNYNVAMNNSNNTQTQLFQKRMQHHRKFFIQQKQKRKDQNELSKPKNLSITCPEIGNFTFTNQPPFDVLGIPQCGNKVQPEFRLYLPINEDLKENATECDLIPMNLPNSNTTNCLEELKRRKDIGKVVLIIHGFLNGFGTEWMHEMQRDIQKTDSTTTKVGAIVIGWGGGILDLLSYWKAAGNARYISYSMFLIVREMHRVVNSRKLYVHCIGHSLGGQSCGLSGKLLIEEGGDKFKYDRISGMDPAGPLFCEDVPYPFNYKFIDPRARLGPNDAHFVDVIHTDGGARYLQFIPQYGTMMSLGTVDFYPGETPNYGCYQPGCYDHLIDVVSCSHSRSHLLYSTSITQGICLAAAKCEGDPHKIPHNCEAITKKGNHKNDSDDNFGELTITNSSSTNVDYSIHKSVAMGYWIDLSLKGLYLVNVTGSEPYCVG